MYFSLYTLRSPYLHLTRDDLKLDVNQFSLTPEYYVGGSRSELFRLVVDPSKPGSAAQHGRMLTRTVEFTSVAPAVVGKQHRYVYWCVLLMFSQTRI